MLIELITIIKYLKLMKYIIICVTKLITIIYTLLFAKLNNPFASLLYFIFRYHLNYRCHKNIHTFISQQSFQYQKINQIPQHNFDFKFRQ